MAYLGLLPSEHSSGSSIHRGGITKPGNAHARRVLIEGPGPTACRPGSAANCSIGSNVWGDAGLEVVREAGHGVGQLALRVGDHAVAQLAGDRP
jgi:hypothetical protein